METPASTAPTASLHQTCINHPSREAAAQCPECRRPFCRECITEHDYRMICASCLAAVHDAANGAPKRTFSLRLMPLVHLIIGIIVIWTFYYQVGDTILSMPTDWSELENDRDSDDY